MGASETKDVVWYLSHEHEHRSAGEETKQKDHFISGNPIRQVPHDEHIALTGTPYTDVIFPSFCSFFYLSSFPLEQEPRFFRMGCLLFYFIIFSF